MKILVPVKAVRDPALPIYWRPDGPEVAAGHLMPNPFDAIALEAAVQWREAGRVAEVVTVTMGPSSWEEVLRTTLALGADRAIRLVVEGPPAPLQGARLLAALVQQEEMAGVVMGKQGVDEDLGQTGPMLAGVLGWPQATFVSQLTWQEGATLLAQREVDGGLEQVLVTLPAVITVDLRLNTPRYASLPNILKAKGKPLQCLELAPGGALPALHTLAVEPAPVRPARGVRLDSAADLARLLLSLTR